MSSILKWPNHPPVLKSPQICPSVPGSEVKLKYNTAMPAGLINGT